MIIIYFYSCIYFNLLPTLNVNMGKDKEKIIKKPQNIDNFNDSFDKDKAFLINRKMDKKMNKFLPDEQTKTLISFFPFDDHPALVLSNYYIKSNKK